MKDIYFRFAFVKTDPGLECKIKLSKYLQGYSISWVKNLEEKISERNPALNTTYNFLIHIESHILKHRVKDEHKVFRVSHVQ